MLDLEKLYSESAKIMKASVIRELLKLTRVPGIISFAGGLPAPETFPTEKIKEITSTVIDREGPLMMQYGPTEGSPGLKEELIKYIKNDVTDYDFKQENFLITTASQQALDLLGKAFINPGDTIVVGLPSYLGALQAFNAYRTRFIGIPVDNDGMVPEILEKNLGELKAAGKPLPKFIYTIPDFQNPAGITYTYERRKAILEIAYKYDIPVIEDSPYRELRYTGEKVESMLSMDKKGYVIAMFTFSKTMIPGFRLGWVVAKNPEIIQKLVIIKQGVDLCTPPFTQAIATEFLKRGYLETQVKANVAFYKQKQRAMLNCLDQYMPKLEGLSWTKPEGGMFLWLTLPKGMNADEMLYQAVEEKVAYVIGSAFFCNGEGKNTMRINFSYPTLENIDVGIKKLARVISEFAEKNKEKAAH
ncbi:MAG: aminotransferase [Candidatus Muiribacterium halophilum]|uniref:Aminotransferase n=1 Tax=Muiribacterium halophilum TaxID=2053465 RepID=A0A2N5Z9J7_MUIH1|nr:MAG: aminotransferase [Candidatus Muirbacterium halophilum]